LTCTAVGESSEGVSRRSRGAISTLRRRRVTSSRGREVGFRPFSSTRSSADRRWLALTAPCPYFVRRGRRKPTGPLGSALADGSECGSHTRVLCCRSISSRVLSTARSMTVRAIRGIRSVHSVARTPARHPSQMRLQYSHGRCRKASVPSRITDPPPTREPNQKGIPPSPVTTARVVSAMPATIYNTPRNTVKKSASLRRVIPQCMTGTRTWPTLAAEAMR